MCTIPFLSLFVCVWECVLAFRFKIQTKNLPFSNAFYKCENVFYVHFKIDDGLFANVLGN